MTQQSGPNAAAGGASPTRTLERGLRILDVLRDRGPSTLTEVATALGLDKSTVRRLLATLVDLLFVDRDRDAKFRLSVKLIPFGRRVSADLELHRVALPYLERLRATTGEESNLAVLHGNMVVWVDTLEGGNPPRPAMASGVWARFPHSTACGKAILAHLAGADVEAIMATVGFVPITPRTLTSLPELRDELRRTRERGYAFDDMEAVPGLRCIAAPVLGPAATVLGAVSISVPASRLGSDERERLAPLVMSVARDISRSMGADELSLVAGAGATTDPHLRARPTVGDPLSIGTKHRSKPSPAPGAVRAKG